MDNQPIFNFQTDISRIDIPRILNNPFEPAVPEISRIAASEFQAFIDLESLKWDNVLVPKGKMFGVLVVQKKEGAYGYLGTISGRVPGKMTCDKFIPSIFDDANAVFFFDKGMNEVSEICDQVNNSDNPTEISTLKAERKRKSIALQQQLFEHYNFLNLSGIEKNIVEIFKHSLNRIPPSGAGECAAPKLLQYAIKHQLKPIAISEFWWGIPSKNEKREHHEFYPACELKCRPILEYMLEDSELFNRVQNKK